MRIRLIAGLFDQFIDGIDLRVDCFQLTIPNQLPYSIIWFRMKSYVLSRLIVVIDLKQFYLPQQVQLLFF